jgi:hypothetical protein
MVQVCTGSSLFNNLVRGRFSANLSWPVRRFAGRCRFEPSQEAVGESTTAPLFQPHHSFGDRTTAPPAITPFGLGTELSSASNGIEIFKSNPSLTWHRNL